VILILSGISFIELTGYLAGLLAAVALSPQLIKSWKKKSTKDISLLWTFIYLAALALWFAYGLGIGSYPLTVFVAIEMLMTLALIGLKLKYK